MSWSNTPRDEQELIINIDYCKQTISLFTTRYAVANRLERRIGKPHKVEYYKDKITGVEYKYPLNDKNVAWLLSKPTIIGRFKNMKVIGHIAYQ